ncbi:MAG: LysM peptidoglycan-binding domain-containing protein, partial [Desulfotomaculaceae bacterium]
MKGKRNLTVALLLGLLIVTAITLLPPACPSFGEDSYTVIDGDCLSIIAEKLGTSVDSIKSTNYMDSEDLQIGQQLVIPGSTSYGYADSDTTYTGDSFSYTVTEGDCLSLIAEKLGASVDSIRSANNLDSDDLQVGQTLVIPGSSPYYSYEDTDYSYTGSTDDSYNYTVAQGDCLSLIAEKFGTSADSIRSANNLDSDGLQVGQTLLVAGNFSSDQPVNRGNVVRPSVETKGNDYGELVDWSYINDMFPMGSTATLQDFETGRTFKIHHLFGENHADCEPLTAYDTSVMKQCFEGEWSWERRAAIIWLDGE